MVETTWIFRLQKLHRKKYVETTWIFWSSNYIEKKTWKQRGFFKPSKLHRKEYVETTWIFPPAK